MFGRRIKLFNLFGFEVRIDFSWIIIAGLITWSLAQGFFPYLFKGLPPGTYWGMGVAGALGLFISIIIHEFFHSFVARRFGIPMKGITLFIFGGVAEMSDEPPSARAEFYMAIVGPLTSLVIAIICYQFYLLGDQQGWPVPVKGVLEYLALINGILAGFNLIPAFPLDGGRVLRSILWGIKGNLRWATRISAQIGGTFGFLLILLGIFQLFFGHNLIGAVWWFLIGLFLRGAAQMSYQQLITRQALEGEPVSRFMITNPVTVPPSLTVAELVEDYIYKYHYKLFPVVDNGDLVGCITTRQVKEIPREEWGKTTLAHLAPACPQEIFISPDTDAVHALAAMNRTGSSRLLVMEGRHLKGIITLKDMMKFFSLKVELGE